MAEREGMKLVMEVDIEFRDPWTSSIHSLIHPRSVGGRSSPIGPEPIIFKVLSPPLTLMRDSGECSIRPFDPGESAGLSGSPNFFRD